jgi:hypothetical protein
MKEALSKNVWLKLLKLPETAIPDVMILRGGRDLVKGHARYRPYFTDVIDINIPGVVQDMFVGRLGGVPVAYASVYGASLAAELVNLFATLGTRKLIHTGCCCSAHYRIEPGDWLVAVEAVDGSAATPNASESATIVEAHPIGVEWPILNQVKSRTVHWGRVYTASACCIGVKALNANALSSGCWACDRETAAIFSAGHIFNTHHIAILSAKHPLWRRENPCDAAIGKNDDDKELIETTLKLAAALNGN